MSILQSVNRPVVVFDVTKKEHREMFSKFVKNSSWKGVPYRFIASEVTEIDVGTMMRQMVQYYTDQEFKKKKLTA